MYYQDAENEDAFLRVKLNDTKYTTPFVEVKVLDEDGETKDETKLVLKPAYLIENGALLFMTEDEQYSCVFNKEGNNIVFVLVEVDTEKYLKVGSLDLDLKNEVHKQISDSFIKLKNAATSRKMNLYKYKK